MKPATATPASVKGTANSQQQTTVKTPVSTTPPAPAQGDYIPCKFTPGQLKQLIQPEVATTLSAADSESVKQQVISEAMTQNTDPTLRGTYLNDFVAAIAGETFASLTPSQALNKVIQDLQIVQKKALNPVVDADVDNLGLQLERSLTSDKESIDSFVQFLKQSTQRVVGTVPKSQLNETALTMLNAWQADAEKRGAPIKGEKANAPTDEMVAEIRAEIPNTPTVDNNTIIDAARNSLAYFDRPPDIGCAMSILDWKETSNAFGQMVADEYIAVQVVVRNLNRDQAFLLHDVEFQVNTNPDSLGSPGRFYSGRDKVIVRAISAEQGTFSTRAIIVHAFEGAGSVMSIAVPIFAAASLANAAAVLNGGIVPGLDKYWKDLSPDQLNLLNDTGFSSQSNAQTTVPQLATVMFVTFIPSKQFNEAWWTQPCVEKHYLGTTLYDRDTAAPRFAFSLSRSAQGQGSALDTLTAPVEATKPDPYQSLQTKTTNTNASGNNNLGEVDVLRAIESCALSQSVPPRHKRHFYRAWYRTDDQAVESFRPEPIPSASASGPGQFEEAKGLQQSTPPTAGPSASVGAMAAAITPATQSGRIDYFRNAYPRPYKKWSGTSLQIFSLLSNVVVAGTHVIEDSQLSSSVTSVNCKTDSTGDVAFPTPDTGTLSCNVAGKNLDKVAQLRLRSTKDQTDTMTAEGPLKVNGDSTTGMVEFPTAALHALPQPAYSIFTVSSKGVEARTGQIIHLSADSVVTTIEPAAGIDFSKNPTISQTLTITGAHLDDINSITLTDTKVPANTVSIPIKLDADKTANQLTVSIDPAALGKLGTKEVTVSITLGSAKKPISQQLKITPPPGKVATNKSAVKTKPVKPAYRGAHGQ